MNNQTNLYTVNDCERVLLLKEDSLNMNCDSWCNSVVATVHYDFAV